MRITFYLGLPKGARMQPTQGHVRLKGRAFLAFHFVAQQKALPT